MVAVARSIIIKGSLAYIPLTQGHTAVIDAEDVGVVAGRNWSALTTKKRKAIYACRVQQINGKQTMLLLHRVISKAPTHLHVDHIDGDGLNNKKLNLRVCTQAQNNMSTPLRRDNKSGYKGVCFDKRAKKWRSEISLNNTSHFLGFFETPEDAYGAYKLTARKLFGDFARFV